MRTLPSPSLAGAIALPLVADEYAVVLATDILVAALFAASLQFLIGTGGMTSFGPCRVFRRRLRIARRSPSRRRCRCRSQFALAPVGGLAAAIVFGWFCVRLSGVYLRDADARFRADRVVRRVSSGMR
jgi:branched-chain amino acid transport system permease protein